MRYLQFLNDNDDPIEGTIKVSSFNSEYNGIILSLTLDIIWNFTPEEDRLIDYIFAPDVAYRNLRISEADVNGVDGVHMFFRNMYLRSHENLHLPSLRSPAMSRLNWSGTRLRLGEVGMGMGRHRRFTSPNHTQDIVNWIKEGF